MAKKSLEFWAGGVNERSFTDDDLIISRGRMRAVTGKPVDQKYYNRLTSAQKALYMQGYNEVLENVA